MQFRWKTYTQWMLHFFFPRTCVACGCDLSWRAEDYLCPACAGKLLSPGPLFCQRCGVNLPSGGAHCYACRGSKGKKYACSLIRSAWIFNTPSRALVHGLKYAYNVYNPESQPNGRIDTQDLNGNGKFDDEDIPVEGNFGFAGQPIALSPGQESPGQNTTWQTYSMPFEISDKSQWTAVRHVRITLKKGANMKGQIKIANVALSGTSWNTTAAPDEFSVSGINNVEDTDYEPIFNSPGDGQTVFNYLYGSIQNYRSTLDSANVLDQALRLKFNTTGNFTGNGLAEIL